MQDLEFVALRTHPELLEETAILLNTVWPRSLNYRLHYLAESRDDFPYSFILLQKDQGNRTKVIGHVRLNRVLGKPSATFLTCVIIEEDLRGCGLGKKLMEMMEKNAMELGCTSIYLSTYQKCKFYEHLGYHYCSQVTPVKTCSDVFTSSQIAVLDGQQSSAIRKDHGISCKVGDLVQFSSPVVKKDNNNYYHSSLKSARTSIHNNYHTCGLNSTTIQVTNEQNINSNNSQQSLPPLDTMVAMNVPPRPPPPPPIIKQPPNPQYNRTFHRSPFWMMKDLH